jgi:DNA-directed RNA polymerase subunit RPC12/RpoP
MRLIAAFGNYFVKRDYLCTHCGVHGEMDPVKNPAMKCPKCGHWTLKFFN